MNKSEGSNQIKRQKIAIICPRIKEYCGVYDYSTVLTSSLSNKKSYQICLITNRSKFHDKHYNFEIKKIPTKWNSSQILKTARYIKSEGFEVVNIQFVSWMFGKYGCPLPLILFILLLRFWRIDVILTAHELYVPFSTWRWKILGILQRIVFFTLVIFATSIIVPIKKWQEKFQKNLLLRRKLIFCVPITSNIQLVTIKTDARVALNIAKEDFVISVFSPDGSGKMMNVINDVFSKVKKNFPAARLCLIGDKNKTKGDGIISIKQSPENKISNILFSSDIYFCPFIDGVSARRGSLLAAMQHGLPIVTTKGDSTDTLLEDSPIILVDSDNNKKMFEEISKLITNRKYREEIGKRTKEFYDKYFDIVILRDEYIKIFANKSIGFLGEKYYDSSSAQYDLMHGVNEKEHEIALGILSGLINKLGITSLIDVGAGTGRVQTHLKQHNLCLTKILGIEPSSAMREIAYKKGLNPKNLVEGTGEKLNFLNKSFDLSCAFGVLHHVSDSKKVITEMLRVSEKAIFISDNNNYGEGNLIKRIFKQSLRALRLWKSFNFIKTKGRGYQVLEGDGPHYSYSIFDDINLIKKYCSKVYFFDTTGNGKDLFYNSSHVAILGIINEK